MASNKSKTIRRILYILLGLVILAFLYTRIFGAKPAATYTTVKVENGEVAQTVALTGSVEANTRLQMQFQKPGKIKTVAVKVGDFVKAGTKLAEIENQDSFYQLEAQKAGLKIAQANLAKAYAGPKNSDLNLSKIKIRIAQIDLNNASNNQRVLLNTTQRTLENSQLDLQKAQQAVIQAQQTLNYAQNNTQKNNQIGQYQLNGAQLSTIYSSQNDDNAKILNNQLQIQTAQLFAVNAQDLLNTLNSTLFTINNIISNAGFNNNPQIADIKLQYANAQAAVKDYQGSIQNFNNQPNQNDINNAMVKAQNAQSILYNLLGNLATTVQNTVPNQTTLTVQILSGYMQTIQTIQSTLQKGFQSFLQLQQNYQTQITQHSFDATAHIYDLNTKANNYNIAQIQNDQTTLLSGKTVQDAQNALNLAQISYQQAQNNYNKATIDLEKQLNDLQSNVDKAQANADSANEQLNSITEMPREVDIAANKAQVEQAWANVHLAEFQFAQTELKSPADGIITKINLHPGELSNTAPTFITIDQTGLEIKALVSEADITKTQIGQEATITFDAFNINQEFTGQITQIAPAETIVQGVIYYEVRIQFDPKDFAVKPGMTANLTLKTNYKQNTLRVPARAVQYDGNQAFVQIYKKDDKNNPVEKRNITVGLQGDENIEVTSGLQAGEEVVTFTKTN